ncbi:ATP-binding protein [Pantoea sp. Ap-967]|uniref:ATP-binding protein n=1 Tax=Pantoea sp. Ap-967 TaxID=2608362 RepID=UPI00141ED5CD|nr:ATP-binding protein [Pantoea sp. Ap-967]NIE73475.1 ATP-binding protein [Pantoea sp. Ap-967]
MTASDDEALNKRLAALDERLAAQPVTAIDGLTDKARELIARVALAGAFDLSQLARKASPDEREALVAYLSDISELVIDAGDLYRRLSIGPRRQALAELLADPGFKRNVLDHFEPTPQDLEGKYTAQLLRGWQPQLQRLSTPQLQSLAVASGWLQGLSDTRKTLSLPDARQVQSEIANRTRDQELQALVGEGLIGRENELSELQDFATDGQNKGQIRVIDGEGGIGKSSLLASLTQSLNALAPPLPIVHFDFDRPSLDPEGPGLTLELTRQLARYYPKAKDDFNEIRQNFKRSFTDRSASRYDMSSSREQTLSSSMEGSAFTRAVIHRLGLHQQPVLLVLDTFEMLAGRGDSAVGALAEWLEVVWQDFDMHGMRVLVAGRAAANMARPLGYRIGKPFNLAPLSQRHARALLSREGLCSGDAKKVAAALDGNPLVLRLVGRYLANHPDDAEAFLKDAAGLDKALGQGVLYTRILNRIGIGESDPLRKLAYPGLVLRVVTPTLVHDVLAPLVLGDELSQDQSQVLFDRLRQHAWLVDEYAPNQVRHRKDLRIVTLGLLRKDPVAGPLAQQLHREAIEYHREECDPDLSSEQHLVEVVYHRLMTLQSPLQLDQQEQTLVRQAMAGDLSELTPYAAALARVYCQMPPLREDLALLPGELQREATAEYAWALIDADRAEEALALPTPGVLPVWWLTAQHDLARWNTPAVGNALGMGHEAFRGIASSSREHQQNALAVSAFLDLWRRRTQNIPKPLELLRLVESRGTKRMTGRLKAMVAWGIGALQERANVDQEWEVMYAFLTQAIDDSPLASYEKARLWLLLWAAGHVSEDDVFEVHGDALSLDDRCLAKLDRLCDVVPGSYPLRACLAKVRAQPVELEQVGLYTRQLAEAITQCQANRIGFFTIAGFTPYEMLPGMIVELRAPTRQLIRSALSDATQRKAANRYFLDLIATTQGTPAALKRDVWLSKLWKSSGNRVLIPFVEWLARMGLASEVCREFERICTGDASRQFHQLTQAWRLIEALEPSPPAPTPRRTNGPGL